MPNPPSASRRAAARPALDGSTAVAAVLLLFAANGLVIGGYAGSLPAIRAELGLDATGIALMLFGGGVAAIVGMQVSGRLTDSLGARRICLAALPILGVGILVFGLAPAYPVAVVGAILLGFANGLIDVGMNALGVHVEKAQNRPYMSRFHGTWSIGNFAGAAAVLVVSNLAAAAGSRVVAPVGILVAGVVAVSVAVAWRITPETAVVHHVDADGVRTPIPRAAWLLGLMAVAFGLGEGTAMDWSSLHVTDVAGVPASTGAAGLVAMSGSMVIIRLLGDRLVARFGRRAIVRYGGAFAAAGYLVVITMTALPALLVGWAMVGFGVGMIAPQVYGAAGHMAGGRGLAVVVTFGYATFLAGPAVIGALVNSFGIARAMILPGLLCVGLLILSGAMPKDEPGVGSKVG